MIRKVKENKLPLALISGVSLYYMLKPKTQEQLGNIITVREQELREFSQSYLTKNQTRVGLDSAIKPFVLEIAKLRSEYLSRFGVEYVA